jgi:circadian clock protein KaiB
MDETPQKPSTGVAATPTRLILFIAGSTPRSQQAEANLAAILAELGDRAVRLHIEIVDVFKDPRRALKQRVLVTPSLVRESHPDAPLIGDLRDLSVVRAMLERAL